MPHEFLCEWQSGGASSDVKDRSNTRYVAESSFYNYRRPDNNVHVIHKTKSKCKSIFGFSVSKAYESRKWVCEGKKFQTKGVGDKIKRRWGGDGDENCKREQKIQTTLISFIFLYCFVKVHFQKSLQTTVEHMAVISQHIVVVVTSCLPTAILWSPARALFCVKTQTVVNANISF